MKISDIEKQVLQLLIVDDPDQEILKEQIAHTSVKSREYTGVGFYTKFDIQENARRFDSMRRKMEDMPQTYGRHPLLPAGAGFVLWLKDGLIDNLEAYTYEGEWPKDESQFTVSRAQTTT
jgi:hypothetical protein